MAQRDLLPPEQTEVTTAIASAAVPNESRECRKGSTLKEHCGGDWRTHQRLRDLAKRLAGVGFSSPRLSSSCSRAVGGRARQGYGSWFGTACTAEDYNPASSYEELVTKYKKSP